MAHLTMKITSSTHFHFHIISIMFFPRHLDCTTPRNNSPDTQTLCYAVGQGVTGQTTNLLIKVAAFEAPLDRFESKNSTRPSSFNELPNDSKT